jgi:hypothetical protein
VNIQKRFAQEEGMHGACKCCDSLKCPSGAGTKFLCSEVIAPIKSEVDDVCLYIINFEDLTAPPAVPAEEGVEANHKLSKREWRCIASC